MNEKIQEYTNNLKLIKLTVGDCEWDVNNILFIEPPSEDIYYWTIEYENGMQVFTTQIVTVVYVKQPQDAKVVNIGTGKLTLVEETL